MLRLRFFLFLLDLTSTLLFGEALVEIVRFGCRFDSLSEREVSVVNERFVLRVLIILLWPENDHFTLDFRVRMGRKEVLHWKLLNQDFLDHGDFAGVRDIILEIDILCLVQRCTLVAATSIHIRLFGASFAQAFFFNAFSFAHEMTRGFIHLAFLTTDSALFM